MLGLSFELFDRTIGSRRGPAADLVNFLANPGFDTDTVWTKATGWTIGSGVATKAAGTAGPLAQPVTLVIGASYEVIFTITAWTAGGVLPQLFGGVTTAGTLRSAAGTFTETLVAAVDNNTFRLQANAPFAGSVDNVSLRRLP